MRGNWYVQIIYKTLYISSVSLFRIFHEGIVNVADVIVMMVRIEGGSGHAASSM